MLTINSKNHQQLVNKLLQGGVAVIKTDTLYGLVARADNREAVANVYALKRRSPEKTCIVLIASTEQLYDEVNLDLAGFWPGPNSLILPSPSAPAWLRDELGRVAYRLPDDEDLHHLVSQTGPLIAPSANTEGDTPATSIDMARAYFGEGVGVYVDEDEVSSDTPPSKLWQREEDHWQQIR